MAEDKLQFYDERTRKFYKLVETKTWPALEISGIIMHRVKDTDPKTDAFTKLRVMGRITGNVLDSCTGLGYTAILAARERNVNQVVTIEKDENVIFLARKSQYSLELFDNPQIEMITGDASSEVKKFEEGSFDCIFHDPPRFALAGELYSLEFYRELYRVLKKNGRLFHYTGKPGIKQGKNYLKGIANRLMASGFTKVEWKEIAQGFAARR